MHLIDLIETLSQQKNLDKVIPNGFHRPHSYRGYYSELAFEPAQNVTVAHMLKEAQSALGAVYMGYKGGEYKMTEYTDVYIANYGDCGESLSKYALDCMLGNVCSCGAKEKLDKLLDKLRTEYGQDALLMDAIEEFK